MKTLTLINTIKKVYFDLEVYRYNYRNGDYLTVTDATGEQFEAPAANILLALQYSAASIGYTGTVTVWYPSDFYWEDEVPMEIIFKKGSPISFISDTNKWIYGQTELLCRIQSSRK
jgi:hypothetical protein